MANGHTPPTVEANAALSKPEKQTDATVSLEKPFAEVTKIMRLGEAEGRIS